MGQMWNCLHSEVIYEDNFAGKLRSLTWEWVRNNPDYDVLTDNCQTYAKDMFKAFVWNNRVKIFRSVNAPERNVDAPYPGPVPGAKLTLYSNHGGECQQFRFVHVRNGLYYCESIQHPGMCIDCTNGIIESGTCLQLWNIHRGDCQLFRPVRQEDGSYCIFTCNELVWDVKDGRTDNGAPMILWHCYFGNNQKFRVYDVSPL
jgi:hypothetical protein